MCGFSIEVNKLEMCEKAAKQKNLMMSGLQEATNTCKLYCCNYLDFFWKNSTCAKKSALQRTFLQVREYCLSDNVLATLLELSVQVCNSEFKPLVCLYKILVLKLNIS